MGACLAVVTIIVLAIPKLSVLPWWAGLFLPFMLTATSLIHEIGHFLVARLHGHSALIQMFKHGQLQARCVIEATGELPDSHTTVRILASGPWTDCAILVGCAVAVHFIAPHPLINLSLMCALLGFTFNLLPGKTSDFARMLGMVSVHRGLLVAAAWLGSVLLLAVALLTLSRLTGLSPL
ncbi:hypothetical protein EBB59_07030 [Lysobacter pythonis]|uniref:Peptidase M50 domain-containing protein n=1 Tax=Solilutibacter pythonis TaxID=2483112 RepID=A0A3M2I1B3_9GAMM|nr:hypothetical protein EBB59_07030 [Lysobacter pythonis]